MLNEDPYWIYDRDKIPDHMDHSIYNLTEKLIKTILLEINEREDVNHLLSALALINTWALLKFVKEKGREDIAKGIYEATLINIKATEHPN